MDVAFDFIASKDAARLIDLAATAAMNTAAAPMASRYRPARFAGRRRPVPSHRLLRIFGEMDGVLPSSDTATITTGMATTLDASGAGRAPLTSNTENLTA